MPVRAGVPRQSCSCRVVRSGVVLSAVTQASAKENEMSIELPAAGGIPPELAEVVGITWAAEAAAAGVDLSGFDPVAPLEVRLAWAAGCGLAVTVVLARFSTKMQQSTADQVRECILFAARHRLYVPPEFVCADEG